MRQTLGMRDRSRQLEYSLVVDVVEIRHERACPLLPAALVGLYIGRPNRPFELHFVDTFVPKRRGAFMTDSISSAFTARGSTAEIEHGLVLQPKFDADGLIAAIVTDAQSGAVLMFAWMNAEALRLSLDTGVAHFWSRSRGRLWRKGEESGNTLTIREARVDCDQDAIWLKVTVEGAGVACHTGAKSCFYRAISIGRGQTYTLEQVDP